MDLTLLSLSITVSLHFASWPDYGRYTINNSKFSPSLSGHFGGSQSTLCNCFIMYTTKSVLLEGADRVKALCNCFSTDIYTLRSQFCLKELSECPMELLQHVHYEVSFT